MKLISITTLALCGVLCIGAACTEAKTSAQPDPNPARGMQPDPNAAVGPADKTGETNPIAGKNVDKDVGTAKTPPSNTTTPTTGGLPTWVVYTYPG